MTNEQYLKTIGYVEKGVGTQYFLESTTEFLNRMSGLIRLFCKLLVYDGPPFNQNLALAWKWFADVLNLSPRSDITALLIRIFLTEADTDMKREMSDDQTVRFRLTVDGISKKSLTFFCC